MPSSSSGSKSKPPSAVQLHREALQRRTCVDWAQREYVELIAGSIKRISDFLNAFDTSVRGRLSTLNEKLAQLERKVDYLEARINREVPDEEEESAVGSPPPDEEEEEEEEEESLAVAANDAQKQEAKEK